jgi:hypothetical protein
MVWLNSVSNVSLCGWFYIMFIVNSVVSVIMLIRVIAMIIYTRPGLLVGSATFFLMLLALAVPVINGAFFYALCDRALPHEGSL